jgi:hypothetical protein
LLSKGEGNKSTKKLGMLVEWLKWQGACLVNVRLQFKPQYKSPPLK